MLIVAHLLASLLQLARNPDVSLVVTSEEELERECGALQQWHRTHGAHTPMDLEREALSNTTTADTRASFALGHRQKPLMFDADSRIRGLLIAPEFTSHELFAAQFTSVAAGIDKKDVRACLNARDDGALFVLPAELADRGLKELRQTVGVRCLCLCVGSAEHSRACLFASEH